MAMDKHPGKSPREIADLMGINSAGIHLLLCSGPDCCAAEIGEASWRALKKKIKEKYPLLPEAKIHRSRVKCLRICKEGPIAVAYPMGKWFSGVTPERVEELVEYLATGAKEKHPLEFNINPLAGTT